MPQYNSDLKFPLPIKLSTPTNDPAYKDVKNLYDSFRLLLANLAPNPSGLVSEAPIDGETYGRKDGQWVEVDGGFPDAPADGNLYGRKNNNWSQVPDAAVPTWGSIEGTLADQLDLADALAGKEPTITPGDPDQYWAGDKTWKDFPAPAPLPLYVPAYTAADILLKLQLNTQYQLAAYKADGTQLNIAAVLNA